MKKSLAQFISQLLFLFLSVVVVVVVVVFFFLHFLLFHIKKGK